eukprot:scaffold18052_cov28-Tisochrysis_lutea.AAC.6
MRVVAVFGLVLDVRLRGGGEANPLGPRPRVQGGAAARRHALRERARTELMVMPRAFSSGALSISA